MPGAGLEVAPVELRVGAVLLDHEHRLAQLPEEVRRAWVEVVEGVDAHVVRRVPGTARRGAYVTERGAAVSLCEPRSKEET